MHSILLRNAARKRHRRDGPAAVHDPDRVNGHSGALPRTRQRPRRAAGRRPDRSRRGRAGGARLPLGPRVHRQPRQARRGRHGPVRGPGPVPPCRGRRVAADAGRREHRAPYREQSDAAARRDLGARGPWLRRWSSPSDSTGASRSTRCCGATPTSAWSAARAFALELRDATRSPRSPRSRPGSRSPTTSGRSRRTRGCVRASSPRDRCGRRGPRGQRLRMWSTRVSGCGWWPWSIDQGSGVTWTRPSCRRTVERAAARARPRRT